MFMESGPTAAAMAAPPHGATMMDANAYLTRAIMASMPANYWMYKYKVEPCPQTDMHNWGTCGYSHPGEKRRRRDPALYAAKHCPYTAQNKPCPDGDACAMAHTQYEYWLHPDRFRTNLCHHGAACARPICFFAHSPEELRKPASASSSKEDPAAAAAAAAALPHPLLAGHAPAAARQLNDLRGDARMVLVQQMVGGLSLVSAPSGGGPLYTVRSGGGGVALPGLPPMMPQPGAGGAVPADKLMAADVLQTAGLMPSATGPSVMPVAPWTSVPSGPGGLLGAAGPGQAAAAAAAAAAGGSNTLLEDMEVIWTGSCWGALCEPPVVEPSQAMLMATRSLPTATSGPSGAIKTPPSTACNPLRPALSLPTIGSEPPPHPAAAAVAGGLLSKGSLDIVARCASDASVTSGGVLQQPLGSWLEAGSPSGSSTASASASACSSLGGGGAAGSCAALLAALGAELQGKGGGADGVLSMSELLLVLLKALKVEQLDDLHTRLGQCLTVLRNAAGAAQRSTEPRGPSSSS